MCDERNYKSLSEFIKIVIDLDDKLYKRVMKKQYNQFKDKANFIYKSAAKYTKLKQQLYTRNSEYTELALMKLNMIHRRKKKDFKNKKSKKKDIVLRI